CTCPERLDVAARVFDHGRGRGDRAHMADEGGARGGGELCTNLGFLHLCCMGLRSAFDDVQRADRVSAVLAVVGVVNVPIIHYSVIWWNSLHQAPSLMRLGEPTMPASMFVPLLLMLLGFTLFFGALLLV